MKSIRFLILACLCFGLNVQADDNPQPKQPVLQRVSVDPLDDRGLVTIEWTVEDLTDVDEFTIFWFKPEPTPTNPNAGVVYPFATVPKDQLNYTYTFLYETLPVMSPMMPDPRETTVPFTVAAVNMSPDPTKPTNSTHSDTDWCMQVSSAYDSCRARIRLNCYPYKGWRINEPPFKPLDRYRVMRVHGGGIPDEEIVTLHEEELSWVDDQDVFYYDMNDVNENETYTFYIEAVQRDGMTSTSYLTTKTTAMPRQPSFIEAVGTQYNSEGFAEVSFKIDPLSETYSYEFLASSTPDNAFVPLGKFNIHGDTTLTDIRDIDKTYYYRLEARHVCNTNKNTPISNLATALWLTLKQDNQVNFLQWSPYLNWGGAATYELHRKNGSHPEEVIATITDPFTTDFRDDMSGVLLDGEVCYWVTAVPESFAASDQYAISNMQCFEPESDIFIPRAFTPQQINTDNFLYKVFFSFPPQEFWFYIYDRNGALVFKTNEVDTGWDGRLMNGKPANEGVYVYYLKFRTASQRLVEKRGTIILIR